MNEWYKANYPHDFITKRYRESIDTMWDFFSEDMILPKKTDEQLDLFIELLGTETVEGFFILQSIERTRDIPGDVCEFGVAQGATSAFMANAIKDTKKNLCLFDSFEGLPAPTKEDELKDDIFNLGSMAAYAGTMKCGIHEVAYRLNKINFQRDRIKIVQGFIDERTINNPHMPTQVSFAFVDFDFYEPIRVTLNYLDTVMPPGGLIVVDDYNFFSTGAKKAVDEFFDKHTNYSMEEVDWNSHFCVLEKG